MSADDLRPVRRSGYLASTKALLLEKNDVQRAIKRMAHEVIERNKGIQNLVVVGIESGGTWVARALAEELGAIEASDVAYFSLDVSKYRDDTDNPSIHREFRRWEMVESKTILLCDDVLFTGRTVRAAFDALGDFGRPSSVQLAVVVDRGHREFPIRADFVGKNIPTSRDEFVLVSKEGVEIARLER